MIKTQNKIHKGMVCCLGFTPNFKTLVSCCSNGEFKISIDHLSIKKTKIQIEYFDQFFGPDFDPEDTEALEQFLEKMVEQADPEDFQSYRMANGISLIHFLIVNRLGNLLTHFLEKVPYSSKRWSYNKAFSPLELAMLVNDLEILNILVHHLKDNPCIEFSESLYWKAVHIGHQGFRDLILSTLFFHSELEIDHLPSNFTVQSRL